VYASYRRIDLAATETAGYDYIFRSPTIIDDDSQLGTSARTEQDAILVPAQIRPKLTAADRVERVRALPSGTSIDSRIVLLHHFKDLESLGLVDDDGNTTLRIGDRLEAIYRYTDTTVALYTPPTPPGLYIIETSPISFSLGLHRNLLEVTVEERIPGVGE
jgi:hypothetical protein